LRQRVLGVFQRKIHVYDKEVQEILYENLLSSNQFDNMSIPIFYFDFLSKGHLKKSDQILHYEQ